jgi:hypothetical protein
VTNLVAAVLEGELASYQAGVNRAQAAKLHVTRATAGQPDSQHRSGHEARTCFICHATRTPTVSPFSHACKVWSLIHTQCKFASSRQRSGTWKSGSGSRSTANPRRHLRLFRLVANALSVSTHHASYDEHAGMAFEQLVLGRPNFAQLRSAPIYHHIEGVSCCAQAEYSESRVAPSFMMDTIRRLTCRQLIAGHSAHGRAAAPSTAGA